MRLFIALDLANSTRDRVRIFMDGIRNFVPDARWVRPESLHVTLKFIGEKSPESVNQIKAALSRIQAAPISIAFQGYGFFPTAKSPRVFWVGMKAGPELTQLASLVDAATVTVGVPKEDHPFTPHLTLARGGRASGAPHRQKSDRPNQNFQRLQDRLTALPLPEFGTMTANEFFLFESELGRGGSRYTKLASFPLK